jgi:hypothetical protein
MLNNSSRMIAVVFQGEEAMPKRGMRGRNDFKANLLHGARSSVRVEA